MPTGKWRKGNKATGKKGCEMKRTKGTEPKEKLKAKGQPWHLRLYIAGGTTRSQVALSNLQRICDEHLAGRYRTEVVDLLKTPQLAAGDQILAVPTLVRTLPAPLRKIIGDLSDTERVLVGLNLIPRKPA